MIRVEKGTEWQEMRPLPGLTEIYEFRNNRQAEWIKEPFLGLTETLIKAKTLGWKEVASGIDPNDLQATCDHRKYDIATDSCQICGKDWTSEAGIPRTATCWRTLT